MARTYATLLGALALVVTIAHALLSGAGVAGTIEIGLWMMAAHAVVGLVAGQLAENIITEAVQARFQAEIKAHEAAAAEGARRTETRRGG